MSKIIFIDARKKNIVHLEIPEEKSLSEAQRLVEGYVQMVLHLENRHSLLVDEDGLSKRYCYGFSLAHAPGTIYVGNGIISRHDEEGDEIDSTIDIDLVRKKVAFHHIQG